MNVILVNYACEIQIIRQLWVLTRNFLLRLSSYALCPVAISKSMIPKLYVSTFVESFFDLRYSSGKYGRVPCTLLTFTYDLSFLTGISRASPKSPIFASKFRSNKIFALLMSPWMSGLVPMECKNWIPHTTPRAI